MKINFSSDYICSISVEVNGWHNVGTDSIVISYKPGDKTANIKYSGIEVEGQDGHRWQERRPGKKKIPESEFNKLVKFLNENKDWYAEPTPGRKKPFPGPAQYILTIKSWAKYKGVKQVNSAVVENWYFKDNIPSDAFKHIFITIANLYKKDFGEEFYFPPKYD